MTLIFPNAATGDPSVLTYLVWVVSIAVSYLLGAVSFARIIGKRVIPDEDLNSVEIPIEKSEGGFRLTSVSATAIRLKAGPKWGCLTSILDMVKAALPVLTLRLLFPESPLHLYAAAAAVIGHNFPVFYRFKGGRGLSPIYGSLFVIDWLAIPVATLGGAIISLLILRYSFVAYFGLTLVLLPWFWFRFGDIHHMMLAIIINVSFWVASIPEVREYIRHLGNRTFDTGHHLVGAGPLSAGIVATWIARRRARKEGQQEDAGPSGDDGSSP